MKKRIKLLIDIFMYVIKSDKNVKQIKIGGEDNIQINPNDGNNYHQIQIGGKRNKQSIE